MSSSSTSSSSSSSGNSNKSNNGTRAPKRPRAKVISASSPKAVKAAKVEVAKKAVAKARATAVGNNALTWTAEELAAWSAVDPPFVQIQGTPLTVSKVPLSAIYEAPKEFTIDTFAESHNRDNLGCALVVDAVADQSFLYDRDELYDEWDLERVSLPIEETQAQGLDTKLYRFVAPSRQQTADFIRRVRQVVANDPQARVAVVSEYGMNRAGVLAISFMVERMGMPLHKAMAAFAKARPPGVYSKSCALALQRRYAPDKPLNMLGAPTFDKEAVALKAAHSAPTTLQVQGKAPLATTSAKAQVPGPMAPPPPKEPAPPPPWVRSWSKREKRHFFFHPGTKKSVWHIKDCV